MSILYLSLTVFFAVLNAFNHPVFVTKSFVCRVKYIKNKKKNIFRNLHSLKHEILKKSRRVIFFLFLYFPYVSKGSKNLLFTQNFPYYLASFIFSCSYIHLVFITKVFFLYCRVKYIQSKKNFFRR